MAPQRVADAAVVSPYPFVVRQERQAPSPPESADRGPHVKGKKPKPRPRAERTPRQEEEPRFNTGPRNLRVPPANRGGRRGFRMPGRAYPEDQNGVPDYPPPSFQEAMTTPPVSVCSSTTSLVLAPTLPLAIPGNIPEHPEEPREVAPRNPLEETTASDNISDSDESIFIIDPNSVPVCSADLPKGAALEERVKNDWRKRRGVEFPGKASGEASNKSSDGADAQNINRGRTTTRPPMLNIDPDTSTDKLGPLSPMSSSKRRFMSLSPLRTIFPRSAAPQDRATLSAHPSPSPSLYPSSRSMFFRSSTSLATGSFLGLPLPSSPGSGKSETLTRKIFKGKERAKDPELKIDAWEVLEEEAYAGLDKEGNEVVEHPRSLMSAVESLQTPSNAGSSSTQGQGFTSGSQVDNLGRKQPLIMPSEGGRYDEGHPLGLGMPRAVTEAALRDWKGPSTAFIDRPINRNRSPVPGISRANGTSISNPLSPTVECAPMPPGPPLTTVRVRAVSPPPPALASKHTAHVVYPSPLRTDARPNILIGDQSSAAAMYQRALDTPLPMTPVLYNHFDYGGSVAALSLEDPPLTPHTPARYTPDLQTDSIPAQTRPFATAALSISVHPSATLTSVVKKTSLEEPMTPTRHHYTGRPLPRPPPSASAASRIGVVDSLYASPESSSHGHEYGDTENNGSSYNTCPEGLLIDLDDTTLDNIRASGSSTPRSDEGRFPHSQSHPPIPTSQASSSSVDILHLADPPSTLMFNSMQGTSTPLRSVSPNISHLNHPPQSSVLSELTELDLLVSRIADTEPDGSDYETLLLISELLGPAKSSAHGPSSQVTISPKASPNGNMSLIGRIEVKRRRQLSDGRVKLKLSLLDVAVDKCGICLSQFKDADMAALTSVCQHSFHEGCLERWLARSKTCPMCRVPLDTDVR